MPFRLKDFAFFYSLQVGVVFFSVIGMVIHTVALLKYLSSSVAETNPKTAVYQYVISFVFIVLGLAVYILGLTGSALENSKIVKAAGSLLVVECVFWIILMGISFSGECYLIRAVCVDNRCPERLYVQNGYWRPNVQECNETDNAKATNGEPVDTFFMGGGENLDELLFSNSSDLEGLMNSPVTAGIDTTEVIRNRTSPSSPTNTSKAQTSPLNLTNRGLEEDEDDLEKRADVDPYWTPIGDLRSDPHFGLSVAYAVLIALFWYLYPVWLMFSFAIQLDNDET